jgi:hypothetical protein
MFVFETAGFFLAKMKNTKQTAGLQRKVSSLLSLYYIR